MSLETLIGLECMRMARDFMAMWVVAVCGLGMVAAVWSLAHRVQHSR